jgi:protein-S-isoprenylcysteine O-methyltransferase Ste14
LPIALVTLAWAGGAYAVQFLWFPGLVLTGEWRVAMQGLGGLLLIAGVPLYAWSVHVFRRAWKRGDLAATGPYAWCRHPIYAAWIFLIVPGLCLLAGSWLLLTTPMAMYAAARGFVRREEADLSERFGETYEAYRRRTGAFLPRPFRRA